VERDYAEALRWYRLAAGQGNAPAKYGIERRFFAYSCG
jgi:TPR repeat protein